MAKHVRVLVVDDSSFYRKRIRSSLNESPQIEVVGEAGNGEEALRLNRTLSPDLITMDVAMPVMDGIEAVRRIMADRPTRIIMFSALTQDGAKSTLEALDAGAVDFLPKISRNEHMGSSAALLRERVLGLATNVPAGTAAAPATQPAKAASRPPRSESGGAGGRTRLLVIGASTGGPVAVQQVLSGLPGHFPVPVLVVIHMPPAFTSTYAERLDKLSALQVSEAADGVVLRPGMVLVAPGGLQTRVVAQGEQLKLKIAPGNPDELYHPSVDHALESAAQAAGADTLGVVLTGMGSDGAMGAQALRRAGGRVWAQDQASSVVYGMPRAVAEAGVAEHILPIGKIAPTLVEEV
jgi:two-component system chemotaxis response regulator CheB